MVWKPCWLALPPTPLVVRVVLRQETHLAMDCIFKRSAVSYSLKGWGVAEELLFFEFLFFFAGGEDMGSDEEEEGWGGDGSGSASSMGSRVGSELDLGSGVCGIFLGWAGLGAGVATFERTVGVNGGKDWSEILGAPSAI